MAHSPGLLLHYKNSDQLGRPGCINLQGADVALITGKERHFKIRKGSRVYYFRTLNKENRQAWLETINNSIYTYEKSWKKAGAKPGVSVALQQSIPSHLAEEWKEQERELNRRLAERMQEVEPMKQVFLQQLQALQHSLSLISGALGFTNQLDTSRLESTTTLAKHAEREAVQLRSSPVNSELSVHKSHESPSLMKLQGSLPPSKGIIHTSRKCRESWNQVGLTCSFSEPMSGIYKEKSVNVVERQRSKCRQYGSEEPFSVLEYDFQSEHVNCIGRDLFRRRRNGASSLEKGHSSDTEVWSSSKLKRPPKAINSRVKIQQAERQMLPMVGRFHLNSSDDLPDKHIVVGPKNDVDADNPSKQERTNSSLCEPPFTISSNLTCHSTQGQLHAAWNAMQDTFAEILKEEIHRVIELEAENAVLQQSLASLPQLQKDHRDLLDLKKGTQLQRDKSCATTGIELDGDINGEYDDDEDMEDDFSLVPSEVTNEDYFEALEVLNQHEFITKATSPEELEILAERAECTQEPPEEGELSEVEGEDYEQPRNRLPTPRPLSRGFSLWTILKNAIGKDLNHITMPATINEPLSVLQRCAEELQFGHLLEKASQFDDTIERLVWVSVFACAVYHGSPHRDAKPFNPLLGETYEWQALDGKSRFIAEQVSHHPPVLAYQCENTVGDYSIYGEVEIKNKFWGKSVEVVPSGVVHLRIPRFGDHFTWSKITTCIHNVVVGKLWIDNYGELIIRNNTTGETSRIRIHKATSREQGRLSGKIFDRQGVPQCSIHGNYMKEVCISPEPSWIRKDAYGETKCIWKCLDPPEDYEQQYCFSRFTIGLNELTPKLRDALPPTDSRFRPDQRALEDGDFEKATAEKLRLEEKQRDACKRRKQKGQEWKCMWFQPRVAGVTQVKTTVDGGVAEPTWIYNGKYWNSRERHNWKPCPDIM